MEPVVTFATLPMPELLSSRDGRLVLLRTVRVTDLSLLAAFIAGLSPASRHRRFHGGVNSLPLGVLRRMTQPDPQHELGLLAIAIVDGQQVCIGEARYAVGDGPPGVREFALVVDDAWQGVGLGTAMLRSLARHAHLHGVEHLVGDVMRDNEAMIEMAQRNGYAARTHPTDPRLLRVTRDLRGARFDKARRRVAPAIQLPGAMALTPMGAPR